MEFYDFPYIGKNNPNWRAFFQRGRVQPPTSFVMRLLKANDVPIRAISSLHLSKCGFNRVASIYIRNLMFDKLLGFLQCASNPCELDLSIAPLVGLIVEAMADNLAVFRRNRVLWCRWAPGIQWHVQCQVSLPDGFCSPRLQFVGSPWVYSVFIGPIVHLGCQWNLIKSLLSHMKMAVSSAWSACHWCWRNSLDWFRIGRNRSDQGPFNARGYVWDHYRFLGAGS